MMSNKELFNKILQTTINNIDDNIVYSTAGYNTAGYNTAGYNPVFGTNTAGYPPTVIGGGPPVEAKAQITSDGILKTSARDGKFYINIRPK